MALAPATTAENQEHNQSTTELPPVSRAYLAAYTVGYIGVWIALLTPLMVTIALRIGEVVPAGETTGGISLTLGIGALLALFGNPLFGRLSDRTTSRFGRRRPWMVAGMLGGTIGLLIMALAPSLPVIIIGWCLTQLAFNAVIAAVVALLPDKIPAQQRGTVSALLGIGIPVGIVGGTFVAQLFTSTMPMFVFPGILGIAAITPLVLMTTECRITRAEVPPFSGREFLSSFVFNPRKNPNFGWAWISRFLIYLGFSMVITFQVVILSQHLGATEAEVPTLVFYATLAQTVTVLITSLIGGPLSDKLGRRKIFVLISGVLYGASLFLIAAANTPMDFVWAMGFSGIGYGLYLATDMALVTEILPDKGSCAAKDLGVFNIANAAPQSIAPAIAPVILAIGVSAGAQNWNLLFTISGVVAVVGAALIIFVRGVK